MNTYIILTDGIVDIGGGQLYVNSKVEFLESKGWRVFVFSKVTGKILIDGLKKYSNGVIRELGIYPMHLTRHRREKVLRIMAESCFNDDNIIIESNSTTLSIWGEMLAYRVNGKHFLFNLNEHPHCESALYSYYLFKYKRGEFATIKKEIMVDFFRPYFKVEDAKDRVLNTVYSVRQVDDVPFKDISELHDGGKNICVIGRLDKPFVKAVVEDLKKYCTERTNENYNIVVIGGDQEGRKISGEIKETMAGVQNVNLFMMGYMFPMPRKLLNLMDVSISSSGAVRSVGREQLLAISIDGNDLKPIGIWGITTENTLFRNSELEPPVEMGILLDAIFEKKYKRSDMPSSLKCDKIRTLDYLQCHLDFINKSSAEKKYFTDFKVLSRLKKMIIIAVGQENYEKLWKSFHK